MQLPREVIVGKGAIARIPEVMQRLGLTGSAMIVAGQKSYEVAGKKVHDLLESNNMSVGVVRVDTATIKDVTFVEERINVEKPSVLFGVGGGSKIAAGTFVSADGGIPYVSVPTTLSHDGVEGP